MTFRRWIKEDHVHLHLHTGWNVSNMKSEDVEDWYFWWWWCRHGGWKKIWWWRKWWWNYGDDVVVMMMRFFWRWRWWWCEKMVMVKIDFDVVCWIMLATFFWCLSCWCLGGLSLVFWWPFGGVSVKSWQCSVMFRVSCSCLGGVSVVSWRCSGVVFSWYLRNDIFLMVRLSTPNVRQRNETRHFAIMNRRVDRLMNRLINNWHVEYLWVSLEDPE